MLTKEAIDAMGFEDRVRLAIMLEESIVKSIQNDPNIPDHHKPILEERLREYLANPNNVIPWEEARSLLKNRLKHA